METVIETNKLKEVKRELQLKIINCKTSEQLENVLARGIIRVVREFPKDKPRGIHEAIQRALEGTLGEQIETVQDPVMESDGTPLDQL